MQDKDDRQYLSLDNKRVQYIIQQDKTLGEYIKTKKKIYYYLSSNINRFFCYAIIGQLIATKVADKIYHKMAVLCNRDFSIENILKLSRDDLRACGMTYKKANYILSFMQLLQQQPQYFDKIAKIDTKNAIKALTKLHGVGKWTAKMLLMFCFDRQDILPVEDLAFVKGYNHLYKTNKTPSQIEKDCQKWFPYASIASRYVYEYADEIFGNIPNVG